jgi:hypothetical protein
LLLHRANLHHFILQFSTDKVVNNLVLLDRQREQVNVLERLDLALLHETTELGARNPSILLVTTTGAAAAASASATAVTAAATTAIATAVTTAVTAAAETARESTSVGHYSSVVTSRKALCERENKQKNYPSVSDRASSMSRARRRRVETADASIVHERDPDPRGPIATLGGRATTLARSRRRRRCATGDATTQSFASMIETHLEIDCASHSEKRGRVHGVARALRFF